MWQVLWRLRPGEETSSIHQSATTNIKTTRARQEPLVETYFRVIVGLYTKVFGVARLTSLEKEERSFPYLTLEASRGKDESAPTLAPPPIFTITTL